MAGAQDRDRRDAATATRFQDDTFVCFADKSVEYTKGPQMAFKVQGDRAAGYPWTSSSCFLPISTMRGTVSARSAADSDLSADQPIHSYSIPASLLSLYDVHELPMLTTQQHQQYCITCNFQLGTQLPVALPEVCSPISIEKIANRRHRYNKAGPSFLEPRLSKCIRRLAAFFA